MSEVVATATYRSGALIPKQELPLEEGEEVTIIIRRKRSEKLVRVEETTAWHCAEAWS